MQTAPQQQRKWIPPPSIPKRQQSKTNATTMIKTYQKSIQEVSATFIKCQERQGIIWASVRTNHKHKILHNEQYGFRHLIPLNFAGHFYYSAKDPVKVRNFLEERQTNFNIRFLHFSHAQKLRVFEDGAPEVVCTKVSYQLKQHLFADNALLRLVEVAMNTFGYSLKLRFYESHLPMPLRFMLEKNVRLGDSIRITQSQQPKLNTNNLNEYLVNKVLDSEVTVVAQETFTIGIISFSVHIRKQQEESLTYPLPNPYDKDSSASVRSVYLVKQTICMPKRRRIEIQQNKNNTNSQASVDEDEHDERLIKEALERFSTTPSQWMVFCEETLSEKLTEMLEEQAIRLYKEPDTSFTIIGASDEKSLLQSFHNYVAEHLDLCVFWDEWNEKYLHIRHALVQNQKNIHQMPLTYYIPLHLRSVLSRWFTPYLNGTITPDEYETILQWQLHYGFHVVKVEENVEPPRKRQKTSHRRELQDKQDYCASQACWLKRDILFKRGVIHSLLKIVLDLSCSQIHNFNISDCVDFIRSSKLMDACWSKKLIIPHRNRNDSKISASVATLTKQDEVNTEEGLEEAPETTQQGAYIMEPKTGLYLDQVAEGDFHGQYPNTTIQFNLCYTNAAAKNINRNVLAEINTGLYDDVQTLGSTLGLPQFQSPSKKNGAKDVDIITITPDVFREWITERDALMQVKQLLMTRVKSLEITTGNEQGEERRRLKNIIAVYDMLITGTKLAINKFYGWIGCKFSAYLAPSPLFLNNITKRAALCLKLLILTLQERGLTVLFADSDCVFVKDFVSAEELKRVFAEFGHAYGFKHVRVDFKQVYKPMFIFNKRTYVAWSESINKLVVKGDFGRYATCQATQDVYRNVMICLFGKCNHEEHRVRVTTATEQPWTRQAVSELVTEYIDNKEATVQDSENDAHEWSYHIRTEQYNTYPHLNELKNNVLGDKNMYYNEMTAEMRRVVDVSKTPEIDEICNKYINKNPKLGDKWKGQNVHVVPYDYYAFVVQKRQQPESHCFVTAAQVEKLKNYMLKNSWFQAWPTDAEQDENNAMVMDCEQYAYTPPPSAFEETTTIKNKRTEVISLSDKEDDEEQEDEESKDKEDKIDEEASLENPPVENTCICPVRIEEGFDLPLE